MSYLTDKKILIISRDKWGFLSLSKHNYAKELAKKNKVYFLGPNGVGDSSGVQECGVVVLNKYTSIKGLAKLPKFIAKELMKIEVKSILNQVDNNVINVVWSFDSSRFFYLDLFGAEKCIAHIVDYSEDFNLEKLTKSADICLSVAESILDKMRVYNDKAYKVDHGYISESDIDDNSYAVEKYVKPTGVYIGNLNMAYVDWESLLLLANSKKEIDFNFYGPLDTLTIKNSKPLRELMKCENVFFKGYLDSSLVQHELRKSTFCIVSYLHKEFGRQLDNSHKIMQYLGSGTPIFSSYTYEYGENDLLCMYSDREKILFEFDKFNSENSIYLTNVHRQKRIAFAMSNLYEKQVEKIEEILTS